MKEIFVKKLQTLEEKLEQQTKKIQTLETTNAQLLEQQAVKLQKLQEDLEQQTTKIQTLKEKVEFHTIAFNNRQHEQSVSFNKALQDLTAVCSKNQQDQNASFKALHDALSKKQQEQTASQNIKVLELRKRSANPPAKLQVEEGLKAPAPEANALLIH